MSPYHPLYNHPSNWEPKYHELCLLSTAKYFDALNWLIWLQNITSLCSQINNVFRLKYIFELLILIDNYWKWDSSKYSKFISISSSGKGATLNNFLKIATMEIGFNVQDNKAIL